MKSRLQRALVAVILMVGTLIGCAIPKQDTGEKPKHFIDQVYEIYTKQDILFSPGAVANILGLKLSETRCISTYPKKEYCGYSYEMDASREPILKNNFRYRINEGRTYARIYLSVNENSECLKRPLIEERIGYKLNPSMPPIPSPAHAHDGAGPLSRPFKFAGFFLEKEKSKIVFRFNESSDCIEAISVIFEKK